MRSWCTWQQPPPANPTAAGGRTWMSWKWLQHIVIIEVTSHCCRCSLVLAQPKNIQRWTNDKKTPSAQTAWLLGWLVGWLNLEDFKPCPNCFSCHLFCSRLGFVTWLVALRDQCHQVCVGGVWSSRVVWPDASCQVPNAWMPKCQTSRQSLLIQSVLIILVQWSWCCHSQKSAEALWVSSKQKHLGGPAALNHRQDSAL